jgi:hypothetical protein
MFRPTLFVALSTPHNIAQYGGPAPKKRLTVHHHLQPRITAAAFRHLPPQMESLLSLSFSNISSRDSLKIRKGLRQIEGLLAQICLSSTRSTSANRRASVIDVKPTSCKKLDELGQDPAFLEFFRLQDGFEWNGTWKLQLLARW